MSEQTKTTATVDIAIDNITRHVKIDRGDKGVMTTEMTIPHIGIKIQASEDVVADCCKQIVEKHADSRATVLTPGELRNVLLGIIADKKFRKSIKKAILAAEDEWSKQKKEEFNEMMDNSPAEISTRTLSEDEMRAEGHDDIVEKAHSMLAVRKDISPFISNEELVSIREGKGMWGIIPNFISLISRICNSTSFSIDGTLITVDENNYHVKFNKEDRRYFYVGSSGADEITLVCDDDNSRIQINHVGHDDDPANTASILRNHPIKLNAYMKPSAGMPYNYIDTGSVSLNCAELASVLADILASSTEDIVRRVQVESCDVVDDDDNFDDIIEDNGEMMKALEDLR